MVLVMRDPLSTEQLDDDRLGLGGFGLGEWSSGSVYRIADLQYRSRLRNDFAKVEAEGAVWAGFVWAVRSEAEGEVGTHEPGRQVQYRYLNPS